MGNGKETGLFCCLVVMAACSKADMTAAVAFFQIQIKKLITRSSTQTLKFPLNFPKTRQPLFFEVDRNKHRLFCLEVGRGDQERRRYRPSKRFVMSCLLFLLVSWTLVVLPKSGKK